MLMGKRHHEFVGFGDKNDDDDGEKDLDREKLFPPHEIMPSQLSRRRANLKDHLCDILNFDPFQVYMK